MTSYEMRISDWSSDVCSSDLFVIGLPVRALMSISPPPSPPPPTHSNITSNTFKLRHTTTCQLESDSHRTTHLLTNNERKSVWKVKNVYVRVDLGGRSSIKTNNHRHIIRLYTDM